MPGFRPDPRQRDHGRSAPARKAPESLPPGGRAGFVEDSEHDRLEFFSWAEHARRVGDDPARLVSAMVTDRYSSGCTGPLRAHVTGADEDAANQKAQGTAPRGQAEPRRLLADHRTGDRVERRRPAGRRVRSLHRDRRLRATRSAASRRAEWGRAGRESELRWSTPCAVLAASSMHSGQFV